MSNGQQNSTSPDDLREEARLEESMEQLKQLYLKSRSVRGTIPQMVGPLHPTHPSPNAFFSSIRSSIAVAQKEVADLKATMTSEESKKLFDDANASRQAKPKGIRPWRATDHPDWTTPTKKKT